MSSGEVSSADNLPSLAAGPAREVLYPPCPGVAFLLHAVNETSGEDEYTSRFASIVMASRNSALLQFHLPTYPADDQSVDVDASEVKESVILDLAARVTKLAEETSRDGGLAMISYLYERFEVTVYFDILPISPELGPAQIQVVDFLLSQFVWFVRGNDSFGIGGGVGGGGVGAGDSSRSDEPRSPNVIAKGFEKAGSLFRQGLKSAGKGTGSAIRYLGKQYTDTTLKYNKERAPLQVDDAMITKVEKRREECESVHATMRSITSTVLLPVRQLGKTAQDLTVTSNVAAASERTERLAETRPSEKTRASKIKQGLYDVGAGLGNGFSNAFKGITEFVEEVGVAIGDSATHHSRHVFGDEYCEKITSKQVEAAGNIGLGVYKMGMQTLFVARVVIPPPS